MNQWTKQRDVLRDLYCQDDVLVKAHDVLQRDEQSEEAFLGAQGVLLLCGML